MNEKSLLNKYILYLDTADATAIISIYKDKELIKEKSWEAGRELSATLSQAYSDILKNVGINSKDLGGVCVFIGPGSFTGLRIGISFVNGLGFALNIPVFETKSKNVLDLSSPKKITLPFYGSEPITTKPKEKK